MIEERVLMFGPGASQVGVLNEPSAKAGDGRLAVIFLNAGWLHHVGPHRLHVQLARALSRRGLASLRIDLSGIGDSPPRADHRSIYDLVRLEPGEAMDALDAQGFQRYALVGICSGAYSAFHVACDDRRVVSAVMINPEDLMQGEGGDAADLSQAWARRYWTRSVLRPRAWLNLVSGRVNYQRLLDTLVRQLRPSPAAAGAAAGGGLQALRARLLAATAGGRLKLLFISSGDDVSREYLDLLLDDPTRRRAEAAVEHAVLERCDHLFGRLEDQRRLLDLLLPWLAGPTQAPRPQGLSKPMSSKYAMR